MTGADGMGTVKGYNRMSLSVGPFKKKKEKYRYLSTKLGDNVQCICFKRIRNKIFFQRLKKKGGAAVY